MRDALSTETKLTVRQSTLAGIFSGVVTRGVVAPFDFIRIRLQLEPENVVSLIKHSYKKEGVRAFWKGNCLAEVLHAVYLGAQFSVYKSVDEYLHYKVKEPYRQFLAGGIAGSAASFASYPLDLLRTRLAAHRVQPQLFKMVKEMYMEQGLRAFFHGAQMSMLSAFPYMSLFFMTYAIARNKLANAPEPLTAGSLASIVAKTTTFPLDTVRRRVQVHGKDTVRMQNVRGKGSYAHGFVKCIAQIIETEGVLSLYKGLGVSLVKSVPSAFLSLFFFQRAAYFLSAHNTHT